MNVLEVKVKSDATYSQTELCIEKSDTTGEHLKASEDGAGRTRGGLTTSWSGPVNLLQRLKPALLSTGRSGRS